MSVDPELRDEFRELHRRLDRLEQRSERSQTLLWMLVPIAFATLAFSIPAYIWVVIAIAVVALGGRLVWLYANPDETSRRRDQENAD